METQETLIPASFDLCDWSQACSPDSCSGKGWTGGGSLANLGFPADKHLNLRQASKAPGLRAIPQNGLFMFSKRKYFPA